MRKVLMIGATSTIAQDTARLLAAEGDRLFLVARQTERLATVADDLKTRGADRVAVAAMDATDYDRHAEITAEAAAALEGLDMALIAHGNLPDQKACESSFAPVREAFETNALSTISLLTDLANHFEAQGGGTIVVFSSVAGDRGRQSNYVYGAVKGAVSIFMQGLRNRLHRSGVAVITIKPGFVDTPMTVGFRKGLLWAQPDRVARDIFRAVAKRKDVVYTPWFWRYIMWIIRAIPERIFKRLHL